VERIAAIKRDSRALKIMMQVRMPENRARLAKTGTHVKAQPVQGSNGTIKSCALFTDVLDLVGVIGRGQM
jgi:hypothetical protein